MNIAPLRRYAHAGLLLMAVTIGLLAATGNALAADRVVVGELFSADG